MPTVREVDDDCEATIKALRQAGDHAGAKMLDEVWEGYRAGYVSASHWLIAVESGKKRVSASHSLDIAP